MNPGGRSGSGPLPWPLPAALLLAGMALLTSGCGGGSGLDSSDGSLTQAAAVVDAAYLSVDLESGAVEPHATMPDLATNPVYRSRWLVLRRVAAGHALVGATPGDPWAQVDEAQRPVDHGTFFIGVFELTRGQWRRLAATTPWTGVVPAWLAGADDDALPACGLSLEAVEAACTGWRSGGRLTVPGGDQWEVACRAGSTTAFSWGEAHDAATVGSHALVLLSDATRQAGPQPVGGCAANALGLYDLHGNVWEWTAEGVLRGGSWRDVLPQARAANRLVMDRGVAHALAGARLVYIP